MSALSDQYLAALKNPNIAKQWSGKKKNPKVPEFIDDARKFIVGETPGEMAFNAATWAGTMPMRLGLGGLSLMMGADDANAGIINRLAKEIGKIGKKSAKATKNTQLEDLSKLSTEDAIAIAQKEPHLIKSGESAEGLYVGGPREVKTKRALTKIRKQVKSNIEEDPRGGDWYDRYRAGVTEVTGGDPKYADWMSKQHGQWSAGVDPVSELQFVLRENNGSLAGMPVKSARPAQHNAHLRAIQANDPSLYQLGEKTGQYADFINPNINHNKATGVNDFRNARERGYTEVSGEAQRKGLTKGQHNFLDYENALTVGELRARNTAGRSDWTGPQAQAAPWVRQKANDLLDRETGLWKGHTDPKSLPEGNIMYGPKTAEMRDQHLRDIVYEDAFAKANKTIADGFNKHTAFATHEAQPGAAVGHLRGSVDATDAERMAYGSDARSTWAFAPGGRDAIYSGLQLGDTGIAGRVRPTQQMSGLYQNSAGALEANPGETARFLSGFQTFKNGDKAIPKAERAILEAGEGTRAFIDAQEMGGANMLFPEVPVGKTNALSMQLAGGARPATKAEMLKASEIGSQYGLPHAVDSGQGLSLTNFEKTPKPMDKKQFNVLAEKLAKGVPGYANPGRVKMDAVSVGLTDEWKQGVGSGAVTRKVLEKLNVTPEMRAAFDNNPLIPEKALKNLLRDSEWSKKWGATRTDLDNARKIIAEGPGWIGRLEEGLKNGTVLPAVAAAILTGVSQSDGAGLD